MTLYKILLSSITSVYPDNKAKEDVLIRADRRITLDELSPEIGVNGSSQHR